jgi:hypothetical protein
LQVESQLVGKDSREFLGSAKVSLDECAGFEIQTAGQFPELGALFVGSKDGLSLLEDLYEPGVGAFMSEAALLLVAKRLDDEPQGVQRTPAGVARRGQSISAQLRQANGTLADESIREPAGMGRHGRAGVLPKDLPDVTIDPLGFEAGLLFLDLPANAAAVGVGSPAILEVLQQYLKGAELAEPGHGLGKDPGRGGVSDQFIQGLQAAKVNAETMKCFRGLIPFGQVGERPLGQLVGFQ